MKKILRPVNVSLNSKNNNNKIHLIEYLSKKEENLNN